VIQMLKSRELRLLQMNSIIRPPPILNPRAMWQFVVNSCCRQRQVAPDHVDENHDGIDDRDEGHVGKDPNVCGINPAIGANNENAMLREVMRQLGVLQKNIRSAERAAIENQVMNEDDRNNAKKKRQDAKQEWRRARSASKFAGSTRSAMDGLSKTDVRHFNDDDD